MTDTTPATKFEETLVTRAAPTPGPWVVWQEDQNRPTCIMPHHDSPDYDARHARGIATIERYNEGETAANARLIAAAPDLLAALEKLLNEVEAAGNATADDYGWPTVVPQARAAIARAKMEG